MTKAALLPLLVLALMGVGCNGDPQTTTAPATTTQTASVATFSSTLPVRGSSFYSFTVTTSGTVSVTLASLTTNTTGPASTAIVGLGLGVPSGTGCAVTNSVSAAAALTAQLTASLTPDVYCVEVRDIGNLTVPTNFTVRIVHP